MDPQYLRIFGAAIPAAVAVVGLALLLGGLVLNPRLTDIGSRIVLLAAGLQALIITVLMALEGSVPIVFVAPVLGLVGLVLFATLRRRRVRG